MELHGISAQLSETPPGKETCNALTQHTLSLPDFETSKEDACFSLRQLKGKACKYVLPGSQCFLSAWTCSCCIRAATAGGDGNRPHQHQCRVTARAAIVRASRRTEPPAWIWGPLPARLQPRPSSSGGLPLSHQHTATRSTGRWTRSMHRCPAQSHDCCEISKAVASGL